MANINSIYDVIPTWSASGVQYRKNDIVKYGDFIYYCITNHTSDGSLFPSLNSIKWSGRIIFNSENKPYFFWKPSYSSDTELEPKIKLIKFGDGWEQRSRDGINNTLLKISYTFDKRSEDETLAICHFLEQMAGAESFIFVPPKPFGLTKKFKCSSYRERYNFYDNHTISANFEEVPE